MTKLVSGGTTPMPGARKSSKLKRALMVTAAASSAMLIPQHLGAHTTALGFYIEADPNNQGKYVVKLYYGTYSHGGTISAEGQAQLNLAGQTFTPQPFVLLTANGQPQTSVPAGLTLGSNYFYSNRTTGTLGTTLSSGDAPTQFQYATFSNLGAGTYTFGYVGDGAGTTQQWQPVNAAINAGSFTLTAAGNLGGVGGVTITPPIDTAKGFYTTAELAANSVTSIFAGGTLQASAGATSVATNLKIGAAGGTVDTNGQTLTLSGAVSNETATPGALTVKGGGTLVLASANTGYTGDVYVSGGVLRLTNLQGAGTGTIHMVDPTVELPTAGTNSNAYSLEVATPPSADPTIFNNTSGGAVILSGAITTGTGTNANGQTIDPTQYVTFSGTSGSTTTLTNTGNSWTGVTTINSGATLQGATSTISGGAIVDNGTLRYNAVAPGPLPGNQMISGSGAIDITAVGIVQLNRAITTTGTLSVSGTNSILDLRGNRSGTDSSSDGGYGSGVLLNGISATLLNLATITGGNYVGVRVTGAGDTVTNLASITNASPGGLEQVGAGVAIYSVGGTTTINNGAAGNVAAVISGSNNAINQRGSATTALTVNNYGTLVSTLYNAIEDSGSAGALTVNNTGSGAVIYARGTQGQGRAISHGSSSLLTVDNSGQMVGTTEGLFSNGAVDITNTGLIGSGTLSGATYTSGGTYGLNAAGGGTIRNAGTASVIQGGSGAGVYSGSAAALTLFNDGQIKTNSTGTIDAVTVFGKLTATNTGTISATSAGASGIAAVGASSSVTNSGTITGGSQATYGYGVQLQGASSSVTNQPTGVINGGEGGVIARNNATSTSVTNSGAIYGTAATSYGVNVNAGSASITNNSGGFIVGNTDGIATQGALAVSNAGTIATGSYSGGTVTVGAGYGVLLAPGGSGSVTNTGTIRGGSAGIYSTGALSLVNTGLIRGGQISGGPVQDAVSAQGSATILNTGSITTTDRTGTAGQPTYAALSISGATNAITNAAGGVLTGGTDSQFGNAVQVSGIVTFNNFGSATGSGTTGGFVQFANAQSTINLFAGSTTGSILTGSADDTLTLYNGRGTASGASTTTYTDAVTNASSTVTLQNAGTLGAAVVGAVNLGGGTNTLTLAGGGDGSTANGVAGTLDVATLTGATKLVKQDSGTWLLTGLVTNTSGSATNTNFAGGTSVLGGTLVVQTAANSYAADALGSGPIAISSVATVRYDNPYTPANPGPSRQQTYVSAGTFSGTGTLAFTGSATSLTVIDHLQGSANATVSLGAGGTVAVQSGNVLARGAGVFTGNQAKLDIASGASFDGGADISVDALTGAGSYVGNGTLGVGVAGGAGTFTGTIGNESGGTLALTKSGAGTQTLTGVNTYTGATTISAGTLALSGAGSLAQSSSVTNNATFDISAASAGVSVNQLGGSGAVVLGANTLTDNATGALKLIQGVISGSGGFTQSGSGTVLLTAANSFTGATTLTGGSMVVTAGGSLAASSGLRVTGGTFNISASKSIRSLSGTGGIVDLGAGYTLTITNGSGSFSSRVTQDSGPGALHLSGGTLGLSGTNDYSGGTTIDAGTTLTAGRNSALGTGAVTNNGALNFDGAFGVTGNSVSGSGAISVANVGANQTLTFGGALTNSGGLQITDASNVTLTGTINATPNGADAIVKLGGGTFTNQNSITTGSYDAVRTSNTQDVRFVNAAGAAVQGGASGVISISPASTEALSVDNAGYITGVQYDGVTQHGNGALTVTNTADGGLNHGVINAQSFLNSNGWGVGNDGGGKLTLTNNAGAIVVGRYGAIGSNAADQISNTGIIAAGTYDAVSGAVSVGRLNAIQLNAGGTITNGTAGGTAAANSASLIEGGTGGVYATGATGLTNYGRILSTGTGQTVLFTAGGTITNGSATNAAAKIVASNGSGIDNTGTAATSVDNYGTIQGTASGAGQASGAGDFTLHNHGTGIVYGAGNLGAYNGGSGKLTVTNDAGGKIVGNGEGVYAVAGTAAVSNAGLIATGTVDGTGAFAVGGAGYGVRFTSGAVTNTGTINSTGAGVYQTDANGTLTLVNTGTIGGAARAVDPDDTVVATGTAAILNSGTITTPSYYGVAMGKGGTLTNAVGGSIMGGNAGGRYGVVTNGADAAIDNYGTISGSAGLGIGSTTGNVTVRLFAGSSTGSIALGGGNDTLTLYTGAVNGSAVTQGYTDAVSAAARSVTLQNAGIVAASTVGAVNLGGGANSVTLRGAGTFTGTGVNTTGAAGSFSLTNGGGLGTLTKQEAGTWTLSGNSNAGLTQINAGVGGTQAANGLLIFAGSGLTSAINVNGAIIRADVAGGFGTGTITATDPTIVYNATGTYSNPILLASADTTNDPTRLQATSGTVATLTGTITQSMAGQPLVFDGAGQIILTNTQSYAGGTTISNGRLTEQNQALAGGTVTVNSGGTLEYNVTGTLFQGDISGGLGGPNDITLTGAGTVIKSGAGTLSWRSVMNLASGGKLQVQAGMFLGSSDFQGIWTNNLGDLDVSAGATFSTVEGLIRVNALTGAGQVMGGYFASGTNYGSLTVGVDNGVGTFDGTLQNANTAAGSLLNLTKTGTGAQTLTNASNSYTGTTTISGGTLALTGAGSIASSSLVTNNATFDISGTTSGASIVNLNGTVGAAQVQLGTRVLTVTNASGTYAGGLTGTTGGFVKQGSGTLIVGGVSSYTGTTTVSGGTLQGTSSSISGGSIVDNATLAYNQTATGTATQNISGSGGITVTGLVNAQGASNGNTLTFSGALTNTGALRITDASSVTLTGSYIAAPSANGLVRLGSGTFTNQGTIRSTSSFDAVLANPTLSATVINAAGAIIDGKNSAIISLNSTDTDNLTVQNAGYIHGLQYDGITNHGSGTLTVTNTADGTLNNGVVYAQDTTNVNGYGVGSDHGGKLTLTNNAGAEIVGQYGAVGTNAADSVTNFGTIASGTLDTVTGVITAGRISAVELRAGGIVTNNAGATLRGGGGSGVYFDGVAKGIVVNSGTIAATYGVATFGYANQALDITNNAGAVLVGTGNNGVMNNGAGLVTVGNSGQIVGSLSGIAVDGTVDVTNSGTIGSGTLNGAGGISGTVSTSSGSGRGISVGNGGSVSNSGLIAGATDTGVYSAAGTLTVGNTGTISTVSTGQIDAVTSFGKLMLTNTGVRDGNGTLIGGIITAPTASGVAFVGANSSVDNSGRITGGNDATYGYGVQAIASGTITNRSGGILNAGNGGVLQRADGVTIDNSGTIYGSGTTSYGVRTTLGVLALTNQAGGTIAGRTYGVYDDIAGGTITNSGLIAAGTYNPVNGQVSVGGADAIYLVNGGTVNNGLTTNTLAQNLASQITGYSAVVSGGALTMTNYGVVTSTGTDAIFTNGGTINNGGAGLTAAQNFNARIEGGNSAIDGTGSTLLSVDNYGRIIGDSFSGAGQASAGAYTLNNFAGAVIAGDGGANSTALGAFVTGGGKLTIDNAGLIVAKQYAVYGTNATDIVTNTGTIQGGTYDVTTGAVTAGGIYAVYLTAGGAVNNGASGATAQANAGSVISGPVGVFSSAALTLTNYGRITGTSGARAGVDTAGAASQITNYGTLAGGAQGLVLNNGGTVFNYGASSLIQGTAGANLSDAAGIYANGNLSLTNQGTIRSTNTSGSSYGVEVRATATLNNSGAILSAKASGLYASNGLAATSSNSGVIASSSGDGIYSIGAFALANSGDIVGTLHGIESFGAAITNTLSNTGRIVTGTIAGNTLGGTATISGFDAVRFAGGTITNGTISNHTALLQGQSDGIFGNGAGQVNVDNYAAITASNYAAIELQQSGTVHNFAGGVITGGNRANADTDIGTGVRLVAGGSVTNDVGATITATSGANSVGVLATSGALTVTNSGAITGNGAAIRNTGTGVSTITLNAGSAVTGAIQLGSGADVLTFYNGQGATAAASAGAIDLGTGNDTVILRGVGADTASGASGTFTLTGLTGAETLTKLDTGTWTLTGNGSNTGLTRINAGLGGMPGNAGLLIFNGTTGLTADIYVNGGTIRSIASGGVSSFGSGTIYLVDPTAQFDGTQTVSNNRVLTVTASASSNPNVFQTVNSPAIITFTGSITTGTSPNANGQQIDPDQYVTFDGVARSRFILANTANNWTGVTQVNSGITLQGTTGTISGGSIVTDGVLEYNQAVAGSSAKAISGLGTVQITGAGRVTLNGNITTQGSVLVSGAGSQLTLGATRSGAVLTSDGGRGTEVVVSGTGANLMVAQGAQVQGGAYGGVRLGGADSTLVNLGSITNSSNGNSLGAAVAVDAPAGAGVGVVVTNGAAGNTAAQISGSLYGVVHTSGTSPLTVNNYGTVSGTRYNGIENRAGTGALTVSNIGTAATIVGISTAGGANGIYDASGNTTTVDNAGLIVGGENGIYTTGKIALASNTGTIGAGTLANGTSGAFTSSGLFGIYANLGGSISNAGLIAGYGGSGIYAGATVDTFTVDNLATGIIRTFSSNSIQNNGAGQLRVTNAGLIERTDTATSFTGLSNASTGGLYVSNSGTIRNVASISSSVANQGGNAQIINTAVRDVNGTLTGGIITATTATAVTMISGSANSVLNSGRITGGTDANLGFGVRTGAGVTATLTNQTGGLVEGGAGGARGAGTALIVDNSGVIRGTNAAGIGISVTAGTLSVTNAGAGRIVGATSGITTSGTAAISNAGTIGSGTVTAPTATVSGTFTAGGSGAGISTGGNADILNSGSLYGRSYAAIANSGDLKVTNLANATIGGGVTGDTLASFGTINILNAGSITAQTFSAINGVTGGSVINAASGTLTGGTNATFGEAVQFGTGTASFTNYGNASSAIGNGLYVTSSAATTVALHAGSTTGSIQTGSGNDTLTLYNGRGTSGTATTKDYTDPVSMATGTVTLQNAGTLAAAIVGTINLGTGSNTLVLDGTGDGTAANGAAGMLNASTVSNVTTLNKAGSGTWTLSGTNTGSTTAVNVNVGTLNVSGGNAVADAAAVTVASGATLGLLANETIGTLAGAGNVSLGGSTLTLAGNASTVFSGVASGTGGLTKQGSGTLILAGANSFTGTLLIAGGKVQYGANDVLADSATVTVNGGTTFDLGGFSDTIGTLNLYGTLANGGALRAGTYNAYAGSTIGQSITTGTLNVYGATTLNSQTAATPINIYNGGRLTTGSAERIGDLTAVNVETGGSLVLGGNETIGSLASLNGTGGKVDLRSYALTVGGNDADTSFSGNLFDNGSGAGSLTKVGTGTLTLSGYGGGTDQNGTQQYFTGATTITSGTIVEQDTGLALGFGGVSIAQGATLEINNQNGGGAFLRGTTYTGTGTLRFVNASGQNTSLGDYFEGANGLPVVLALGQRGLIDVQGAGTVNGSSSYLSDYSANQASLNIGAGATFSGVEGTIIVDALTGSGSYRGGYHGSGSLTVGVANGSGAFSGSIGDLYDNDGNFVGAAVVNKAGTGTQTLSGVGTYTGATNINAGTLIAANGNAIGDTSAVTVADGAIFQIDNAETVGSLAGAGNVILNETLSAGGNDATTAFSGVASGTGGLSKNGAGTLTLSGANSYTGDTSVFGGTLALGASGVIADASNLVIDGGGTLDLLDHDETVASAMISGTLDSTPSRTGTLTASTYTLDSGGGLWSATSTPTVNGNLGAGTLVVQGKGTSYLNGTAAANSVTITGGTLVLGGDERLNDTADVTVQSDLNGAGVLDLGGHVETVGTLQLTGSSLNSNGGPGTLTATSYGLDSATVNANLGSGVLTQQAGTSYLYGTAGAGTVNVAAGTLQLGDNDRLADSAAVTVASGATLDLLQYTDTVGTLQLNGTLAGTGTLTAATYTLNNGLVVANLGTGTLINEGGTSTLTGTAGAATVNVTGGTLLLGAGDRLADDAAVTVASGAILDLATFSDTVGTLALSGSLNGSGTLAAATYALNSGTANANFGTGTLINTGGVSTLNGTAAATTVGVDAGTLTLAAADRLADTAVVTVASGAVLDLATFSDTVGTLALNGSVNGTGTLTATSYALNGGTANANLGAGTLTNSGGMSTMNGTAAATSVGVNAGTLTLGAADRLADTAAVTVASGAVLDLATFSDTVGTLALNGSVNGTGTLTATSYALNGGTANANLGAGTLTNSGGMSTLNGTAAATSVGVNAGTLTLGAADRLADTAAVTVASGAVLDLATFSDTVGTLALNGSLNGTGTLTATSYALNGGTANGNLGAGTLTNSGGVSTLNGTAAAATVGVNAGTLTLGAANRLADNAAVTVASGAILDLGTFSDTVGTLALNGTLNGSGTLTAAIYALNGATINANLGAGTLTNTGGVSTLNGTAAAVTVGADAGTLTLGAANRLADAAAVTVASGAVLDLKTFSDTVGTLALNGSLNGTGTLTAASYTLNAAAVNGNLGAGILTQAGGTSVLAGTSAAATVNLQAGTLRLAADERLLDAGAVTIASSATFDVNGRTETIASVTGAGTVALGAGRLVLAGAGGSSLAALTGTGIVDKTGTGTLTLANRYAATGSINTAAGSTVFTGSTAGALRVSGGTLSGTGTAAGTLTVTGGTVAPGSTMSPFGTLTVGGLAASGGAYAIDFGGAAFGFQSDLIRVNGAASLGGAVAVTPNAYVGNEVFQRNFTVLQANSLTGSFSNFATFTQSSSDPTLFYRLRYDLLPNAVVLQVQKQVDFTATIPNGTPNQRAVARALNGTAGMASDSFAATLNTIAGSGGDRGATYDSLSGEALADVTTGALFVSDQFMDLIHARFGLRNGGTAGGARYALRAGMTGGERHANGFAGALQDGVNAEGGDAGTTGGGLWLQGYGAGQRLKGLPGQARTNSFVDGLAGGFDGRFGAVSVGVAGGFSRVDTQARTRGSTAEGTLYQGGAYLGYDGPTFYAQLAGDVFGGDIATGRQLVIGGTNLGQAQGTANVHGYTIGGVLGARFDLGGGTLAGFEVTGSETQATRRAFTETAPFGLNLTAARDSRDVFTGTAQVKLSHRFEGRGWTAEPFVSGGVQVNSGDLATVNAMQFGGAPTGTGGFLVQGASLEHTLGIATGGIEVRPSDKFRIDLTAGVAEGKRTREGQIKVSARLAF